MDFANDIVEAISKSNGNVYRTRNYIVRQRIQIQVTASGSKLMYSADTYYARTKQRDIIFEKFFAGYKPKDGKRIKTAMYTRTYID